MASMNYRAFIAGQVESLRREVGRGIAINALSGGVDSSVVTVLAHRALGPQMKTILVDNALMREGEPRRVVKIFRDLGIPVELVDARKTFLRALRGLTDPEEKRQAITDTFYKDVFGKAVKRSRATFLLHGTILTDIEETVAGIKRQHNILAQLGIDPQKAYGYKVLEPLATVRKATAIVEEELGDTGAFQYLAVLLNDCATGIRKGRREFGQIIVVRCIDSVDARRAAVRELPWPVLHRLTRRITAIPGVNRCLYDLTPKPPATVEYI